VSASWELRRYSWSDQRGGLARCGSGRDESLAAALDRSISSDYGVAVTSTRSDATVKGRALDSRYLNHAAALPYGLTVAQVAEGVRETYRLYDGINRFLASSGFRRLEELLLGNSLSSLVSELLVKNIARASTTLVANKKVGGHPDLLPKDKYPDGSVLKSTDGIEVKTSQQRGGWQGHNREDCWVMVFRYTVGPQPDGSSVPVTFTEVMCAKLLKQDWSFSGRKGASRGLRPRQSPAPASRNSAPTTCFASRESVSAGT